MPLFSKSRDKKEKRKELGHKVSREIQTQKRIGGLARGYEKLEAEKRKTEAYKKTLREQRPSAKFARAIERGLSFAAQERRKQLRVARDIPRPVVGAGYKKRSTVRLIKPTKISPQKIAEIKAYQRISQERFIQNNPGWDAHFIARNLENEVTKKPGVRNIHDEIFDASNIIP